MPERIRIFVDFWNFALEWSDRIPDKKIESTKKERWVVGQFDFQGKI